MNMDVERIQQVLQRFKNALNDNDWKFINRVYGEGIQKYADRIAAIGFTDKARVLDAGCGFGQWSLALAACNGQVSACDISPLRIEVLQDMTVELGLGNLDASVSSLDALPFPDASFDAIFCYGVVNSLPWRTTFLEFKRLLAPGGKLYFTFNELGWYVFLWKEEYNKARDYDPRLLAAQSLLHTLGYDREGLHEPGLNVILDQHDLKHELERMSFQDIHISHEGGLHLERSAPAPKPFFQAQYYGLPGTFECFCSAPVVRAAEQHVRKE